MSVRWTIHRGTAILSVLLLLLLFLPLIAAASPFARPLARIEPAVLAQLSTGKEVTVWVILKEQADLRPARTMRDRNTRGRFVYNRLRTVADASQRELRRMLRGRGVAHRPFWIANAIQVTADQATLQALAARPEVDRIIADGVYELPKPIRGAESPRINAVEWGIARIRAPEVWNTFGIRGEGIIIANIDTGVEYNHPALIRQYRGNHGGSFDHNYNWHDPSEVCGSPSLVPCDNNGHGTHTMGTMVGDDGDPGENQIGVAPHATWIAAKGCEEAWCSYEALLSSGQWVLAPTDLNGSNPRPDLRPHIVNNSWGGGAGDPFYREIVGAWVASGIFPAFANGNSGPECSTVGSPGDYPESYGVGAFAEDGEIASFSSRGPSLFDGESKPNIAAPGVDVRSSVPGHGYEHFSGTSMATPHLAGTIALIWSAAPTLVGDIETTRALLAQTAIDVEDLSCGGTAANNNVWGEGRLDAFAAVDVAPRGPTGTLRGAVTDAGSGLPVADATLQATGPSNRTTRSGGDGSYSMRLPVGSYDLSVRAFGYLPQNAEDLAVTEDGTTVQDFALLPAPSHAVSGFVRDGEGNGLAGVLVIFLGTPISPATTGPDGAYHFPSVPEGSYDVAARAGGCFATQTQALVVDGNETLDFTLPRRVDNFGYFCQEVAPVYIEGDTILPLSGDDVVVPVSLPFRFTFYGRSYDTAYVTSNGFLNFLGPNTDYTNRAIPNGFEPNGAIYPYWDDLYVDDEARVLTGLRGEAPNRQFIIEWRNIAYYSDFSRRVDFEVILFENGRILTQYRNIDDDSRERGNSATLGIENSDGSDAFQYSFNQAVIGTPSFALLYNLPSNGFVEGQVTDAVDRLPITGAMVTVLETGQSIPTDASGRYRIQIFPVGDYTLEVQAANYRSEQRRITILEGQTVTENFALGAARMQVEPAALEFVAAQGSRHTQTLRLSNRGMADLTFSIREISVRAALATPGSAALPPGANSRRAPAGYTPRAVKAVLDGGSVLVFMDALPWDSEALTYLLEANGIPYDVANSSQMGTIDFQQYEALFISSDQPRGFYTNYTLNLGRFEAYVESGGFLWVGAAAWGWNGGDFSRGPLPGGARVSGALIEASNHVVDHGHPIMHGVPNPFFGTSVSHTAFENLPEGTTILARADSNGMPTLIEYQFGAGRVLALGQTLEYGFDNRQDAGLILFNGIPYAYAFEPVTDVPWLSVEPTGGTVAAGGSQEIRVTVDTTGLAPGLHRAQLIFRTNDPRNSRLLLPVTLMVSAYHQAANIGGGAYTDVAGELWAADRRYRAGSWGYVGRGPGVRTRAAINGTDDDPLYQRARRGRIEYRFDGLPAGTYEVELRFAEIQNQRPGRRLFDVTIEGNPVLVGHDIADEVGRNRADNHTFLVTVNDGQLNIRFLTRRSFGHPIINGIRVIHRPDS